MTDRGSRFYAMPLEEAHVADMLLNVAASLDQSLMAGLAPIKADSPLVAIVDEDDGGIIAYAIGESNAQRVVVALEDVEGPKGVNG